MKYSFAIALILSIVSAQESGAAPASATGTPAATTTTPTALAQGDGDKLHFFNFDNSKMLYKGDWAEYKKTRPHDNDCSIAESDNWKGAQ